MLSQNEILGEHPIAPDIFEKWVDSNDITRETDRCHRSLISKLTSDDPELTNWLAKKIVEHHYSSAKIERLRRKYKEVGFPQYASQHRQLPLAGRTRKGNATEIVLIEYIASCQEGRDLVKYFKFRYNPNVDQSMKGDDALIIDVISDEAGKEEIKVFLGEAKFRTIPDKEVIKELCDSLGGDKLPLSFTFMVDRLYENENTEATAELLEQFIMEEVKAKGNLKYIGLLLSNKNASANIERHFNSDNPQAIILSLGIGQPQRLISEAFDKAEDLIANPDDI
ncbi:Hachiman antiphage defense system protein HamA [Pedobacter sp. MR22-3]|uniref:Hachiman antiphage defense system protein HamA n=1 Tax=Pedobacter sp. MR22-3 TaxID=2994552 RepID=UPI002245A55C|nr:Hachiman antiphage defense system protein HamA [Pedobacter sp. MR22-3]MCX2584793.1 SAVED domain-containing protein [Pedobacter sp. MR22-3]